MAPDGPVHQTRRRLAHDLRRLGLASGDTVLAHASMRRIGPVEGGPIAVVQALQDVVGADGTVAVPTMTAGNSDPARWGATRGTAVDPGLWPMLRETMLPFDPAATPSFGMGVVAETVRTWPGAVRSAHPQTSFAAVGRHADRLMAGHDWRCHLGPTSPLAELVKGGSKVLLLGVGYEVCTAFHLAEYVLPSTPVQRYSCVVRRDGSRRWFEFEDIVLDDSRFGELGQAFERARPASVSVGAVGCSTSRLFDMRAAVDFAVRWLDEQRAADHPGVTTGATARH